MLPDPNISETATNHEELIKLLRDINTFPEGTNPDQFDNIKCAKIINFLASETSVGIKGKDFAKIIKSAEFEDESFELFLTEFFFKSESSSGINGEDFVEII